MSFALWQQKNQQVPLVSQSRHLKLCQNQIVSDLVIVQEEEEHLLKITINMAIIFPTSTLGQRHKCRGIWLFPLFSFEKIYEWLMRLLHLYLDCMSKFLARYKSLSRKTHGRWRNYSNSTIIYRNWIIINYVMYNFWNSTWENNIFVAGMALRRLLMECSTAKDLMRI